MSTPNIDQLREEPEYLESSKGLTRYLIAETDRNENFGESEWFCDDCGALVEDTYEGCPVCNDHGSDFGWMEDAA